MLPIKVAFTALSTLVGVVMAVVFFLPIYAVLTFFSALGVAYRLIREHLL